METSILIELFKHGTLFAAMSVGLYVFYKKDETRRANDLVEREAMRTKLDAQELRIENYPKTTPRYCRELVRTQHSHRGASDVNDMDKRCHGLHR